MSQAASAGLFIYAKDLERVAAFYQRLLGMQAIHSSKGIGCAERSRAATCHPCRT
ncbi:catechol-2,3-dioxygenase [Xanthomonas arboricola]|nr:catechol-2,3-dioxygenase [Xanthomonas campestris]